MIGGLVILGGFVVLRIIFLVSTWFIGGTCPPNCATCAIATLERISDLAPKDVVR